MKWSSELKSFRKARCLTQGALADIMNVEQPTVSRWERGVHEPDLGAQKTLRKLIFGKGTNPDSLIVQNVNYSPFAIKIANRDGLNIAASSRAAALHGTSRDLLASVNYRPFFTDSLARNWDRAVDMGFFEGELASVVVYNQWLPVCSDEPKYCVSYWTPARLPNDEIVLVSEFELIDSEEHNSIPEDRRFMARVVDLRA